MQEIHMQHTDVLLRGAELRSSENKQVVAYSVLGGYQQM